MWFTALLALTISSMLLLLYAASHYGLLLTPHRTFTDLTIVPQVRDAAERAQWHRVLADLASREGASTNITVQLQILKAQDKIDGHAKERRIAARILGPNFAGGIEASTSSDKGGQRNQVLPEDMVEKYKDIMSAPPGRCPRVNSSLSMPLGSPNATNVLCHPLINSSVSTIAIVGNGPLSQDDRASIETRDLVIRFNLMNNWVRYKERLDLWVARFSTEATHFYWGFSNLQKADAERIVESIKGLWLVGGNQTHADHVIEVYPRLMQRDTVLVPHEPLILQYARSVEDDQSSPSTGFVAILAALHCSHPHARLHLYGMNWSTKMWSGHKVDAEKAFVSAMERQNRILLHPTACSGMRECEHGDIDASCHWDNHGQYMCLLMREGHKKWVNMTHKVSDERIKELKSLNASQSKSTPGMHSRM